MWNIKRYLIPAWTCSTQVRTHTHTHCRCLWFWYIKESLSPLIRCLWCLCAAENEKLSGSSELCPGEGNINACPPPRWRYTGLVSRRSLPVTLHYYYMTKHRPDLTSKTSIHWLENSRHFWWETFSLSAGTDSGLCNDMDGIRRRSSFTEETDGGSTGQSHKIQYNLRTEERTAWRSNLNTQEKQQLLFCCI